MILGVKEIIFPHCDYTQFELISSQDQKFCCEKFKSELNDLFHIHIKNFCLVSIYDDNETRFTPIKFCPFCGDRIWLKIVRRFKRESKQVTRMVCETIDTEIP